MFVIDGVAYAGEPAEDLKVASVSVVNDWCMVVTFSTGEQRLFDATELFGIPVFGALKDLSVFNRYEIDHGVLSWDCGVIDIAPEALYERSYEYGVVA